MINYTRLVSQLDANKDLRRVTSYVSPTQTVKLTRQFRSDRRNKRETYILTSGAPNYRERLYIKLLQKAKEPFPVRKLKFDFWPKSNG